MNLALRRILLTPLLLIQGCGFHLTDTHTPISACLIGQQAQQVKSALKTPLHCTKESQKINVKSITSSQQEVSNSTNNTLNQFQISHSLQFDILSHKNKVIKSNILLTVNKPFISNANGILSSGIEQGLLNEETKQELYSKFERYLERVVNK